jgi:hypothetical protein
VCLQHYHVTDGHRPPAPGRAYTQPNIRAHTHIHTYINTHQRHSNSDPLAQPPPGRQTLLDHTECPARPTYRATAWRTLPSRLPPHTACMARARVMAARAARRARLSACMARLHLLAVLHLLAGVELEFVQGSWKVVACLSLWSVCTATVTATVTALLCACMYECVCACMYFLPMEPCCVRLGSFCISWTLRMNEFIMS